MKHVVIRSKSAGVFVGEIESKDGQEVVLKNARRLWFWSGASSLSQLSQEGVKYPENCKFPREVPEITIFEVIEIIPMTDKAVKSIKAVPVWES